jgi:hypothetical protein
MSSIIPSHLAIMDWRFSSYLFSPFRRCVIPTTPPPTGQPHRQPATSTQTMRPTSQPTYARTHARINGIAEHPGQESQSRRSSVCVCMCVVRKRIIYLFSLSLFLFPSLSLSLSLSKFNQLCISQPNRHYNTSIVKKSPSPPLSL